MSSCLSLRVLCGPLVLGLACAPPSSFALVRRGLETWSRIYFHCLSVYPLSDSLSLTLSTAVFYRAELRGRSQIESARALGQCCPSLSSGGWLVGSSWCHQPHLQPDTSRKASTLLFFFYFEARDPRRRPPIMCASSLMLSCPPLMRLFSRTIHACTHRHMRTRIARRTRILATRHGGGLHAMCLHATCFSAKMTNPQNKIGIPELIKVMRRDQEILKLPRWPEVEQGFTQYEVCCSHSAS